MDNSSSSVIIGAIALLLTAPINIAMLIQFFKFWKFIRKYVWYGFTVGIVYYLIVLIFNIISTAITQSGLSAAYILSHIISAAKLMGIAMLGIYYCRRLNLAGFPFAKYIINKKKAEATKARPSVMVLDSPSIVASTLRWGNVESISLPDSTRKPDIKKAVWAVIIISAAGIFYSLILFHLTNPTITREVIERELFAFGDLKPPIYFSLITAVMAAWGEEITFRLGIQNFLAIYLKLGRSDYWAAIMITAFLWTLLHWGNIEPGWVKMVQIFPAGLALGWAFKKYGVEVCIATHAIFNVILVLIFPVQTPLQ